MLWSGRRESNSHQLGRNLRACSSRLGCAFWSDLLAPRGTIIDSGLGPRRARRATAVRFAVLGRYILKLQAMVELSVEELAAAVAPTLQRYIDGPVDGGASN
jgi:hypothetical protein